MRAVVRSPSYSAPSAQVNSVSSGRSVGDAISAIRADDLSAQDRGALHDEGDLTSVGCIRHSFYPSEGGPVMDQTKRKFNVQKLEERIAPRITAVTTQTNGGGNEPKGEANGVPT